MPQPLASYATLSTPLATTAAQNERATCPNHPLTLRPLAAEWSWATVVCSDNAVNPTGARNLGPLIQSCLSLKVLALNNTGVGTLGGEVRTQLWRPYYATL